MALVAIDSISVLAHQHAAGLPAAGPTVSESNCTIASEPADHALGSSRGGWTTKIRALVDGTCPPVAVLLTAGQVGDNPQLAPLLEIYPDRHGCTMRLLAGKAYSHPSPRKLLRTKHISHTIPERSDQIARRKEKAPEVGDHRPSMSRSTDTATPSSGASTDSSTGAVSQPATTSTPSPTSAAYSSPRQSHLTDCAISRQNPASMFRASL